MGVAERRCSRCLCWWTGGGEPPGMMGILTCQTPNLPSLSFSSPPPSPRGTGPPLCPCPSQELNSEEHLCKCSVRFHRADFGAPARLWALGLGLLLAAHLGAFPLLMTLSCPAHSVSSCPSQGRATLEVWAGAEGTRAGLLAFLSPWPYSLMSSFSDSGCAQVWFCSSDSDLSGLPYVQEELWHWVMGGWLPCPCLSLLESALYLPQGIILWFGGSEVSVCHFPPQVSILRHVS